MALALYRKYRPTTFAELIGQEHVTEPLIQALRSGRLNHAYLFSGPRGCGKTSSARILARSLNCEQGPTSDPCGTCESCRALSNDGPGSIDVLEIDAASHGGVDDARDLRERAFFTPVSSRYKIYVIDEAHMVSSAGFNALLKLVEEPPEFVKFVFATTEPDKVLPTIRSRTHHYPFRLIPPSVVRPYLEQLCAAEQVTVEPAVFPLVVRAGGGSMRDTLSVLDQLIAGAGPEGITYARAAALLGVTDAALLDELCDALVAGDGAAMFATVDRVAEAGHDARRFAADLLERLRDLMVLQQVPDAASKGLLNAPADQLERMSVHAAQLGPATLSRCADIVHTGLVEMRGTTSPRLLLELICARMLLPGAEDSHRTLLQRLEQMERRLGAISAAPPAGAAMPEPAAPTSATAAPTSSAPAGAVDAPTSGTAPAESASAPSASAPPAAAPPPAPTAPTAPPVAATGTLDAAALRRVWEEIVATVGRRSKRTAAVVREATVQDVEGNLIVLHFQHAVHATMLAAGPQPLLEAVQEVLGGQWQVRCESGDGPAGGTGRVGGPRRPPEPPSPPAPAADPGAPTPAGGSASPAPSPSGAQPDAGGWPEIARPGGAAPTPPPTAGPAETLGDASGGAMARAAASGAAGAAPLRVATTPGSTAVPAPTMASEAPTAPDPAPAPAESTGGATPAPSIPRAAAPATAVADPPVQTTQSMDPVFVEQQALRLLQQSLGAEKIGEVAP